MVVFKVFAAIDDADAIACVKAAAVGLCMPGKGFLASLIGLFLLERFLLGQLGFGEGSCLLVILQGVDVLLLLLDVVEVFQDLEECASDVIEVKYLVFVGCGFRSWFFACEELVPCC